MVLLYNGLTLHPIMVAPYNDRTLHWYHPTMVAPYNGRTLQWSHPTMVAPYNGCTKCVACRE